MSGDGIASGSLLILVRADDRYVSLFYDATDDSLSMHTDGSGGVLSHAVTPEFSTLMADYYALESPPGLPGTTPTPPNPLENPPTLPTTPPMWPYPPNPVDGPLPPVPSPVEMPPLPGDGVFPTNPVARVPADRFDPDAPPAPEPTYELPSLPLPETSETVKFFPTDGIKIKQEPDGTMKIDITIIKITTDGPTFIGILTGTIGQDGKTKFEPGLGVQYPF